MVHTDVKRSAVGLSERTNRAGLDSFNYFFRLSKSHSVWKWNVHWLKQSFYTGSTAYQNDPSNCIILTSWVRRINYLISLYSN